MFSFTLCSYNIGNEQGYRNLIDYANQHTLCETEEECSFEQKYEYVQKIVAANLRQSAHAFCLQGVENADRFILQTLKAHNFSIVHIKDRPFFYTAIALDNNRFSNIENHSFIVEGFSGFVIDIAVATALDKRTNQKILFASLFNPRNITTIFLDNCYEKEIDEKICEFGDCQIRLIGMGMQFETNLSAVAYKGFNILRTNWPTSIFKLPGTKPSPKKTDFIFAKQSPFSILSVISSQFFQSMEYLITGANMDQHDFNPEKNASNHRPIFVDVTVETVDPTFKHFGLFCTETVKSKTE